MTADRPIVIGLNLGHDGGAALLAGQQMVAISEERLNRTRYSGGWHASLAYCLDAADVAMDQVDQVVFSCVGPYLPRGFTGGLDRYGMHPGRISAVDHHLSHAYSAFCLSGFDEALVVVADGAGNDAWTESYYLAGASGLARVGGNRAARPRAGGIGATYTAVSNWLGFDAQEAGKTMALAAYGDPAAIGVPLFDLNGAMVEGRLARTHEQGLADYAEAAGIELGPRRTWSGRRPADLAAWVQAETERALIGVVGALLAEHGRRPVCLAGGVAMNCVANEALRAALGVEVFVPPPASDRGQALGNALSGTHRLTSEVPRLPITADAFGRTYSDEEIRLALRRHPRSGLAARHPRPGFSWRTEEDPAALAAQLIAAGLLVGWFDGGSELGARALGGRCILADPRHEHTRDVLNTRIKHREVFRPFAPAVLDEDADTWFAVDGPSPFMLRAVPVRAGRQAEVPAVVHVDGTARVQTVGAAYRPAFHRLISLFGTLTGVPMVVSTSFNDSEPIVETPAHALATFLGTGLDALIINGPGGGGYAAEKTNE